MFIWSVRETSKEHSFKMFDWQFGLHAEVQEEEITLRMFSLNEDWCPGLSFLNQELLVL